MYTGFDVEREIRILKGLYQARPKVYEITISPHCVIVCLHTTKYQGLMSILKCAVADVKNVCMYELYYL